MKKGEIVKENTKFDQFFINDEEDIPKEKYRCSSLPRNMYLNPGIRQDSVMVSRKPNMTNELVFKPKDLSIRAFTDLKNQAGLYQINSTQ
jgi:hypothetical protein